jgi:hypothetical protein
MKEELFTALLLTMVVMIGHFLADILFELFKLLWR